MSKFERSSDIGKLLFSTAGSDNHDGTDIEHSAEDTLVDTNSFDLLQEQLQRVPADYSNLDDYSPVSDSKLRRGGLDVGDQCRNACDSQQRGADPRQPKHAFVQQTECQADDREEGDSDWSQRACSMS